MSAEARVELETPLELAPEVFFGFGLNQLLVILRPFSVDLLTPLWKILSN